MQTKIDIDDVKIGDFVKMSDHYGMVPFLRGNIVEVVGKIDRSIIVLDTDAHKHKINSFVGIERAEVNKELLNQTGWRPDATYIKKILSNEEAIAFMNKNHNSSCRCKLCK